MENFAYALNYLQIVPLMKTLVATIITAKVLVLQELFPTKGLSYSVILASRRRNNAETVHFTSYTYCAFEVLLIIKHFFVPIGLFSQADPG